MWCGRLRRRCGLVCVRGCGSGLVVGLVGFWSALVRLFLFLTVALIRRLTHGLLMCVYRGSGGLLCCGGGVGVVLRCGVVLCSDIVVSWMWLGKCAVLYSHLTRQTS